MRLRTAGMIRAPLLLAWCGLAITAPQAVAMSRVPSPLLEEESSLAQAFAEDEGLARIIEAVQKRYSAKVVKVTEVTIAGRRAYDLKLLSEQRVWVIRVDAEKGQELPRSD